VPKLRKFFKYWLPVLVWMILIFSASADAGSSQRSSRLIRPILLWLFPSMPDDVVFGIVLVVRKCAHLGEYAILAILLWRAIRQPVKGDPRPWSWREAWWSVLIVAFYAATDEMHQRFVPNREATVRDVLIDTTGGLFGVLFLWVVVRWCKRKQQRKALATDGTQMKHR
jgi:VanZ family protein